MTGFARFDNMLYVMARPSATRKERFVMPDYRLSDEQRQYQKLAREFAENEIAPRSAHLDESGEFPVDIYRQAWELGLMNVHIPEAYGGFGLNLFDGCLIA